ncbi:MAG TPA: hypothetical protein VEY67_08460 [Candidatus Dormibacteraeota bacterium]|nr:hypothetical protein [Candidatus Dormibacteraeota bacterium]
MRSKNVRRPDAPPARDRGYGSSRGAIATRSAAMLAAAMFVLGASGAILLDRAVAGLPKPSPSPSADLLSPSADASPSGSPGPTPSPSPSPSPAAPELVAMMPTSIDGTTLSVQSTKDASQLGTGSGVRALSAAIKALGGKPADLEIAEAGDPNGTLKLQILAFRAPGIDPKKLEPAVTGSLLAEGVPGVTHSNVTIGGKPALKVSYGDAGDDEYVIVHADALFVIETADASLAAKAAAAIGGGTSGSPAPSSSGSAVPSGSAGPSASPGSSPSPS